MKNLVTVKRVGGGEDCGKLRIIVDVTFTTWDEIRAAEALDCKPACQANLGEKPMKRSVGPVADGIVRSMFDGLGKLGVW